MKIASWNINSINSRLPNLLNWLNETQPEIVLLQELKCLTDKFPREAIEDLGYNLAIHGQKTYNGVAILSKYPIDEFTTTLLKDPEPTQSRYIEAVISVNKKAIRVASVYVPNGQEIGSVKFKYKLAFFDALHHHLQELLAYDEITVIGGDFNVAPNNIDVFDPKKFENCVGFSQGERQKMQQLFHLGYTDAFRMLHKDSQEFSWWDYRAGAWHRNHGMRIDLLLLSPEACQVLTKAEIEYKIRGQDKPSDHVPVTIQLKT
jgi:exodeoxyribonuclease-3